jgi:hypothetical protein
VDRAAPDHSPGRAHFPRHVHMSLKLFFALVAETG